MPFDHLIQNINLPDGTDGVDVGIREEKIIAVEKNLDAEASVTTDGSNCMLSPPFVDSHFLTYKSSSRLRPIVKIRTFSEFID